jgi:hypothetical protein
VLIDLTEQEMRLAIQVGTERCISSWGKGSKHAAGYRPKDLFDTNIKGAAAEIAVAKMLDVYYVPSVNTYKSEPDISPNIEVRMTQTVPPCLIIRPNDVRDRKYVAVQNKWVHGQLPKFKVLGWEVFTNGVDKMWEKYLTNFGLQNRPHCWAIPAAALHKMEAL